MKTGGGSIGITLVLYLLGRREKRPVFNSRDYSLVRRHLRKLKAVQLTFNGEQVADLTLTRVALWNRGRDPINRGDVAPKDPVRIEAPDGAQVLEATLDYITSPVNAFEARVSADRRTVEIDFDYFHLNEGCVLSVYHTASTASVKVLGTIKGAGQFRLAVMRENALVFAFLDNTVGRLVTRERRRRGGAWKVVALAFIPILVVPFALVQGIEIALRWSRKPPKEFSLEGLD